MKRSLTALFVFVTLAAGTAAFTQSFSVSLGQTKGPTQPIAFSHQLHAGKLGMDCRYCHYSAEKSPIANIPPVSTCMGCHKIAATDRPEIQKLTGYFTRGEPVPWVEVYRLPDHVKFNHKRHVKAGLECQQCHGPVQEMQVVYQYPSLKMGWCVSCHRQNLANPTFPATMDCIACHH
jgi:cytochrome c7-like protein